MSLRPLYAAVALVLALWAAVFAAALPLPQWPMLPWRAGDMNIDQILLAFGLMPRMAVALLIGAMLGLAGGLMQAVLRNPLADPTTLGTSAGAQLAIIAASVFAPGLLAGGSLPIALAGAGVTTALVMMLGARRGFAPVTITIAGMLVGMLAAAIGTAITLAQGHYLLTLVIWNGGALTQNDWWVSARLLAIFLPALAAALLLARPLMLLSLGEAQAKSLGLGQTPLRFGTMLLAVMLAAIVAAEVGLVGFIGLAAPAAARALGARTLRQRLMLAPVAGAVLLALADALLLNAAALGLPSLPTGALTGLIGGPLLLWLLPRMRASVPQQAEDARASAPRAANPRKLLIALAILSAILGLCGLMLGQSQDGWGIPPIALWPNFLPIRATTLLAAASAGALLAGAGAILQRMTANPMAAPEVLGVTGGASLGYAAAVFLIAGPTPLHLAIGTTLGAALTLAALTAFALRADMAPARLLLAGLAIGAFASAVLAAIMASDDRRAWAILGWLAGSATHVTPVGATALAMLAALLLALLIAAQRWLDILPLGAEVSRALGLPLLPLRLGLIAAAGLATGAATIWVGPVSFVGLMAPHLARSLGLVRPLPFVIGSWLLGALLMAIAAFGARTVTYPYDLPLGLFATLIGAPWLFILLLRKA
ncbi:iron-hydroxamate transporter permease subunit (plasmid) [Ketogulonicigenium vulgare Y25]|uniref:Transport system permease protein n=1 Tax=Ketogulonicigenium vulgare (strain WSH-001) TaxID=759362 RepID=F9YB99_KETVW|nr:Fe(3+)-hydroxamate ABC transporter permease FhuB [Ketogulonicigenium vulgare]ADO44127.1 iron-hydroxamate transporter permease subunit [Ketogulonicigenium vulgare Y25]AEM42651.1 Transport system permease protein [Ketogulonicigenium vulgare WSH-001]ALJ82456.1 ABC transporter permease [Ketogulonicigenium vulgare]AOZ53353.1 iron-hydroxamate transporter permease subunit [Ketogulonicigenium vulgare]